MLKDLKFYFSLFLRRFHYFLIVASGVTGIALTLAYTLPPVYEAEAQLLVESPQIPGELASSTVQTSAVEILQINRQRLLTRSNLLEIARDFDVFEDQPPMSPDDIVEKMRDQISMKLPNKRDAAAFVTISFKAPSGALSARVVNNLVTRMLEENVAMRKASAGQTLDFFRQEVARLDQELADQGQRILQFKMQNQNALPDSLDYRRTRQASIQERLLQIEREIVGMRDRRDRLQEMYQQTGGVGVAAEQQTPEQRRLSALRDELAAALTIYSEQNPRIQNLQRQVDALEAKVNQQVADTPEDANELTPFDIQMADMESQMQFLAEQRTRSEKELEELNKSIDATPANIVILGTLERDYENLRVQYNQATSDLATARTGDQIEAQSRGQRITVIEQAVAPSAPTAPNRRLIAVFGTGLGIALGIALIVILELLHSSIRRPADLANQLGLTPFVTVPYIRTRKQKYARRFIIVAVFLFVAIGIPAGLYWVDSNVMPMDLVVEKVLRKSGLSGFLTNLGFSQ